MIEIKVSGPSIRELEAVVEVAGNHRRFLGDIFDVMYDARNYVIDALEPDEEEDDYEEEEEDAGLGDEEEIPF